MKFYIFSAIILLGGLTLIGCTQQSAEQVSTSEKQNVSELKDTVKPVESKDSEKTAEAEQEIVSNKDGTEITVYKSPTCGCCTAWETHLTKAGFKVVSKPTDKMIEVRKEFNVPDKMQSCHTAIVDGYVIEGHVPASDVQKLLSERPTDIVGLAAPGMPAKSPGMQPEGEKPSGYDVLSFDKQGNSKVFASYK
jgi:hypothetical protein